MDKHVKWYMEASLYSDSVILVILTISLFQMFLKLRLRIDAAGIVTLTVFWISSLTKLISAIQIENRGPNGIGAIIFIMSL